VQSASTDRAVFHRNVPSEGTLRTQRLGGRFLWEFICDGRTPVRALTDATVAALIPYLEGPGRIIELGAAGDYYRKFASPDQQYIVSNLDGSGDIKLDMSKMDLDDSSVDAFISIYALEHLFDYQAFFDESLRCLKPGGRMLLVAPFLYQYHAAPDDFFRFSVSALERLLSGFEIIWRGVIGGRSLLVSEMYHEKVALGGSNNRFRHFCYRMIALPFLIRGLGRSGVENPFTIAHILFVHKSFFSN
jgi:SAM-dependent methyltransferase